LDHIPIITELNLEVNEWEEPPHPNFRLADWKAVRETLMAKLTALAWHKRLEPIASSMNR